MWIEQDLVIDAKLKKYELGILEFLNVIGEQKRTNPKITTIMGYFYIYNSLTQQQLKQLTGFSLGTISNYLNVLMNLNFNGISVLEKRLIPGTHKFTYTLMFKLNLDLLIKQGIDIFLGSVNIATKLFKRIEPKIKEINSEASNFLLDRFNNLLDALNIYNYIFDITEQFPEINFDFFDDTKEFIEFEPKVKKFERRIIDLLVKLPLFSSKRVHFTIIFGYFITRGRFTQDQLKQLTGLSKGTISQELKEMMKSNLITSKVISSKGKTIYYSPSTILMFLNLTKSIIKVMLDAERDLTEMKNDLDYHKKELENLSGYEQISTIITFFLELSLLYKITMQKVEEVIERSSRGNS